MYKFKIIIIGDSSTGKTNILTKYRYGLFDLDSKSTIGIDYIFINTKLNDNDFKIVLWDTSGQERFRSITASYYRGCHAVLYVSSIDNEDSVNNYNNWIKELERYQSDALQYFVLNKIDLYDHPNYDKILTQFNNLEQKNKFLISAKSGLNIENMFNTIIQDLYNIHKDNENLIEYTIDEIPIKNNNKKCCI